MFYLLPKRILKNKIIIWLPRCLWSVYCNWRGNFTNWLWKQFQPSSPVHCLATRWKLLVLGLIYMNLFVNCKISYNWFLELISIKF
jgi:hypothetical protein